MRNLPSDSSMFRYNLSSGTPYEYRYVSHVGSENNDAISDRNLFFPLHIPTIRQVDQFACHKQKILRKIFLLFFVLFASSELLAVVVTNTSEFVSAVNNKETYIELNAPLFVLNYDLNLSYDCNIVPHASRSGQGGVVIDCNGNRNFYIYYANVHIGCTDPNNFITFANGKDAGVYIFSYITPTYVTFDNCNFNYSKRVGVYTLSGAAPLSVIMNNCRVLDNYGDGVGMHNISGYAGESTITLNSCIAQRNGTTSTNPGDGDGATAHNPNHKIYIHGGVFTDNGKTGVAMTGGSKCYIDGNTYFSNNGTNWHWGDVTCAAGSYLDVNNAEFFGLNYPATGLNNVWATEANAVISNCIFYGMKLNTGNDCRYVWSRNSNIEIKNSIFIGSTINEAAFLAERTSGYTPTSCVIENCIFGDNFIQIELISMPDTIIKNCILNKAYNVAIVSDTLFYNANAQSGYNCFFGNWINFSDGNDSIKFTDITEDPCFVRPTTWNTSGAQKGDYHLKSQGWRWDANERTWVWDSVTSRCIDAGCPSSFLGEEPLDLQGFDDRGVNLRIDIGAYGGTGQASMGPYNWALQSDLDNDGIVNFYDFAEYANLSAGDSNLSDINRDGLNNFGDLLVIADEWLKMTSWYAVP